MDKKKKILIVGNSAKEYALVKKFKNYDCDIFVLSGNFTSRLTAPKAHKYATLNNTVTIDLAISI